MKTKGIHSISLSVSNIERALLFYRDYAGFKVIMEDELRSEWVCSLWKLPSGVSAHRVVLKGDLRETVLELVQFKPGTTRKIREGASPWDYGVYCFTFLVKDVDLLYRDLSRSWYQFVTPPIQYQPNLVSWPVKEVTVIADDGILIDNFMRVKAEDYPTPNNVVRLDHSAWMVDSYDRVKKFFINVAGLDQGPEMAIPEGLIDGVILLPKGHRINTCFFSKKDENSLVIECLNISMKGKSLANRSRPPNLGIFQYSFEVEELEMVIEKCRTNKFHIIGGPVQITTEHHGSMRAITVDGPLGVMFEFFQRMK